MYRVHTTGCVHVKYLGRYTLCKEVGTHNVHRQIHKGSISTYALQTYTSN